MLIERFGLSARGSTPAAELRGAFATFLTMAYILFANPTILSAAGVPFAPAVAATAAAAAVCCILMGVVANFPLALASGMGLNAVIAYQIAPLAGSWQIAMGLVVLDGILAFALVMFGLREAVMPPVTYGSLRAPEATVAVLGLLITAVLIARRVTGAIVLGIVASTVFALTIGAASFPRDAWTSVPSFATVGQADVLGALRSSALPLVLPLLLVDFFDTIGTATAIADEAELHDDRGQIPGVRRVLAGDSLSAAIGGFFGVSSVTSYTAIPAFVLLATIPFTYSISHGIGFGFIAFVAINLLSAKWREVHPLMYAAAVGFAAYFVLG